MTSRRDRARGALYGLAVGDALGMPTQSLPRSTIVSRYGPLVDTFHPGAPDQPIAPGLPAGTVTDDTEQALLLARLLVERDGRVPAREWASRLSAWEDSMRARGSLDLLGPSTRRALDDLVAGVDPASTGRTGDTNGAAMRIAPVGIATPPGPALLERVIEASGVTHRTSLALAGAAAVAAAISAALDGADLAAATAAALDAADEGARRGVWVAGAHVADRIRAALVTVSGARGSGALDRIDESVGTSLRANESVPAAFAVLHAAGGDVWESARFGASVGGDCDTIAAMAAAMGGALTGVAGIPVAAVETVDRVNRLDIDSVVDDLLRLRDRS